MIGHALRRLVQLHDAVFTARWRAGVAREVRRREQTLAALVFLQATGIEDPMGYHSLELTPELLDTFHRWHRSAGIDRFPDTGLCC